MRKMSNLDFRPLYMYTHMYTRKKRGRREGGMDERTNRRTDGWKEKERTESYMPNWKTEIEEVRQVEHLIFFLKERHFRKLLDSIQN